MFLSTPGAIYSVLAAIPSKTITYIKEPRVKYPSWAYEEVIGRVIGILGI